MRVFYLNTNEVDIVEPIIISIYRKIKADKLIQYYNALDLIKFFNTFFKTSNKAKQQEALLMFFARNKGEHEIANYLQSELKNSYLNYYLYRIEPGT